ncbi:hypothetical protein, partial [Bacillus cereus]|uniref:hypothetical protein n=1 Tax=Bacillus cereus TaxID=1396 RepID=UPI0019D558D7
KSSISRVLNFSFCFSYFSSFLAWIAFSTRVIVLLVPSYFSIPLFKIKRTPIPKTALIAALMNWCPLVF